MGAMNVTNEPLVFGATIETDDLSVQYKKIEDQLKGLSNITGKESQKMEGYFKSLATTAAGLSTVFGGTQLVADIFNVRAEFQKLEAVLTNTLGSKDLAKSVLGQISDYAATTPFQLQEIASSYVKLANQGFTPVKEELTALGDLAASQGKSFDQVTEGLLDLMQGEGERMKEIGLRTETVGDKMRFTFKGVTTEVDKNAEAIRNYVVGLGQLDGVAGSTAAISATLSGQLSNLRDSWDQMLNTIGESSEGVFSTAIDGAKLLVDNYQTVLKVLGVLSVSYGTYRTALMLTNAASVSLSTTTKGLTALQILHKGSLEIASKAMGFLNKTLLANPFVATATVLTGLITTFALFGKTVNDVKSKAQLLDDAQSRIGNGLAETEAKMRPYVEALKNANLSEAERLNIYNQIKAVDPEIVKGLDAKTLSYEKLNDRVKEYLKNLRNQYAIEANKDALGASIKQEQEFQKRLDEAKKNVEYYTNYIKNAKIGDSNASYARTLLEKNKDIIAQTEKQLKQQESVTEQLGTVHVKNEEGKQEAILRTIDVIDKQIAAERKAQKENSASRTKYLEYEKKIKDLEAERERITGKQAASDAKAQTKAIDQRKEQLNSLIEAVADAEREAARSGLIKEESEIDRINARYDDLVKRAKELKADGLIIDRIGNARNLQINNTTQKQQAEEYKKGLQLQKEAFDQFEEYKANVGIAAAQDLMKGQLGQFDSYIAYLSNQLETLRNDKSIGGQLKFNAVSDEYKKATEAAAKKQVDEQYRLAQMLLGSTKSFLDQKTAIEDKYRALNGKADDAYTKGIITNLDEVKAKLKANKEAELTELQNAAIRQSDLYKKLGTDLINYTKGDIEDLITSLEDQLQSGSFIDALGQTKVITPAIQKEIEAYIKQLKEAIGLSEELQAAALFDAAGSGLNSIAASLGEINQGLGETVSSLGTMATGAAGALKALDSLKNATDVAGQIGAASDMVSAIMSVVIESMNAIKKTKESKKQAEREIRTFYDQIALAEQNITLQYRERARQQIALNNSTLTRVEAERKLLEEQKKAASSDYASALALLQGESFVSGMTTKKKKKGLLTSETSSVEVLSSLRDMSFEQIEKLYAAGQLTDKAKALFEQLQKIKAEGEDIDKLLEENRQAAAQIFTGTTADSITDSIVNGFKQGKRTAQDFASDFQGMMQDAMFNALKFQTLEPAIKELYAQFAASAQSGGQLTAEEISNLQATYNNIIASASEQFQQLQQIAGINTGSFNEANSMKGAISGITENTAELIAGRFGSLQMTALQQLQVASQQLAVHQRIEANTANTVLRIEKLQERMEFYFINGVKMK